MASLKGLCQARLQLSRSVQACSLISQRAMSSRLFVGGLSFTTEEDGLRNAFSKHGEVVDARIVTDRESGRSRGFGFVTLMTEAEAETAKNKMNGQFLDGRVIRVDHATPRPAPPRPSLPAQDDHPSPQDWGTIPSSFADVPQNGGFASPGAAASSELPTLDSLASSASPVQASNGAAPPPPASPLPSSTPTPPPAEPARPSFSFNFDFGAPDPNFVPRPRPPRLRPSMMDFEFGFFSDTSKFPFNTNFATGFLKVRGPESEFDFSDIREFLALKKTAELAAKQEAEAAAAASAKEAEEAAAAAIKEANEIASKQAQEAVAAAMKSSQVARPLETIHIQQEQVSAVKKKESEDVLIVMNASQELEEAAAKKEVKEGISTASFPAYTDIATKQEDTTTEREIVEEESKEAGSAVTSSKAELSLSSATTLTVALGPSVMPLKQQASGCSINH